MGGYAFGICLRIIECNYEIHKNWYKCEVNDVNCK